MNWEHVAYVAVPWIGMALIALAEAWGNRSKKGDD